MEGAIAVRLPFDMLTRESRDESATIAIIEGTVRKKAATSICFYAVVSTGVDYRRAHQSELHVFMALSDLV